MAQHQDCIQHVKIRVDDRSHIRQLDEAICSRCARRPCETFCPSQVFKWENECLAISYERCVECGACLRGCPYTNVHWDYPRAGFGIVHQV